MTEEQIEQLLSTLERIASALEAVVPQQRPPNPRLANFEVQIREIVREEIKADKIKVPQK